MIKIYGGSLVSLVLAEQLVRRNQQFEWYTLGERIGGHFAGLPCNGIQIDIGMVLLELDPGVNNPTRYARAAKERNALECFLASDTVEAKVKSFCNGVFVEDYMISDNTEAFRLQSTAQKINASEAMHPREKWSDINFEQMSYSAVCEHLYPGFYEAFLEKIAAKITGGKANELSARYHRSAWMPLYYPETILGCDSTLVTYSFQKIAKGSFSASVVDKTDAVLGSAVAAVNQESQLMLSAADLKAEENVTKFFGCDMLKIPEMSDAFCSDNFFSPLLDFAVLEVSEHAIDSDFPDCVFDVDDEFIFELLSIKMCHPVRIS